MVPLSSKPKNIKMNIALARTSNPESNYDIKDNKVIKKGQIVSDPGKLQSMRDQER